MPHQTNCWNCGGPVATAIFCPACDRIQPCDESRNPFDVLGLQPSISSDNEELTAVFFELSRRTHPDFFGAASAEEQSYSLQQSAQVNDAYRRLSSFHGRVTAFLDAHQLTEELEAWKPPGSLLMQVLEWNEELDELESLAGDEKARRLERLRGEVDAVHEETVAVVSEFSEGADERLLDMVGRIQYISRLKERIEQIS